MRKFARASALKDKSTGSRLLICFPGNTDVISHSFCFLRNKFSKQNAGLPLLSLNCHLGSHLHAEFQTSPSTHHSSSGQLQVHKDRVRTENWQVQHAMFHLLASNRQNQRQKDLWDNLKASNSHGLIASGSLCFLNSFQAISRFSVPGLFPSVLFLIRVLLAMGNISYLSQYTLMQRWICAKGFGFGC